MSAFDVLLLLNLIFISVTHRYLVGLAGPPGSGKTTLSSEVVGRLNKLWIPKTLEPDSLVQPDDIATVLPMDGFHLYRSQLDAMEVSFCLYYKANSFSFQLP